MLSNDTYPRKVNSVKKAAVLNEDNKIREGTAAIIFYEEKIDHMA